MNVAGVAAEWRAPGGASARVPQSHRAVLAPAAEQETAVRVESGSGSGGEATQPRLSPQLLSPGRAGSKASAPSSRCNTYTWAGSALSHQRLNATMASHDRTLAAIL